MTKKIYQISNVFSCFAAAAVAAAPTGGGGGGGEKRLTLFDQLLLFTSRAFSLIQNSTNDSNHNHSMIEEFYQQHT